MENCCIWLVIYLNCTMMHGLANLKFIPKLGDVILTTLDNNFIFVLILDVSSSFSFSVINFTLFYMPGLLHSPRTGTYPRNQVFQTRGVWSLWFLHHFFTSMLNSWLVTHCRCFVSGEEKMQCTVNMEQTGWFLQDAWAYILPAVWLKESRLPWDVFAGDQTYWQ